MYPYVHSSSIYSSQGLEAMEMSINRCVGKEDAVCLNNGVLLIYKREWNNVICNNMDGPRDYHIKWTKSDTKYNMISLICGI